MNKNMMAILFTSLLLFSGCEFFGRVSNEVQKTAGDVKQGIDTTIKNTTDTINSGVKKVGDVTNAVGDLQESLGELGSWGNGNGNKNTNST